MLYRVGRYSPIFIGRTLVGRLSSRRGIKTTNNLVVNIIVNKKDAFTQPQRQPEG